MSQKLEQMLGAVAVLGYLDPWAMAILILAVIVAVVALGFAICALARIAIR